MPENLSTWSSLINNLPPWVGGALMSIVISILRVTYEKEETTFTRIALESLICGGLTITAGSLLEAMSFGQNWYLGCGGVIGFMGSQYVRAFANRFFTKKADKI
jgi:lambda family phage holin